MKRRIIGLLLSFVLSLGLIGYSNSEEQKQEESTEQNQESTAEQERVEELANSS